MKHAIVIDFETANGSPSSVCSVGIVIVRDGEVVDSFYSLIHPPWTFARGGFLCTNSSLQV